MVLGIDIVKVYRISHPNKPADYRRTLVGAFNKLAWGIIFEKYDNLSLTKYIKSRKYPLGYECNCLEDDNDLYQGYAWDNCEIHDRHMGYYKRLHGRLVSYLMMKYEGDEMPSHFRKENHNDG